VHNLHLSSSSSGLPLCHLPLGLSLLMLENRADSRQARGLLANLLFLLRSLRQLKD